MLALEVTDLVVTYETIAAVDGVSFCAESGEFVALLGPSGCGKTTTLRAIAGLETPSSGRISVLGGTVFDDVNDINVPTERRDLSMVFQSYAIWPHMTVFENVVYGLQLRKYSKDEARRRVEEALDLVGLSEFVDRPAPLLSGGQQQRVALARSFVFEPKLLLFDEPLSNLDAKLRNQMRNELKQLQERLGITSIYVTHDQEEALSMADRIIVMNNGQVEQEGDPLSIYYEPATPFVADFIGSSNIVLGERVDEPIGPGLVAVRLDNGGIIVCDAKDVESNRLAVAIKSVHLKLTHCAPPEAVNAWEVRVTRRSFAGDFVEYRLDWKGQPLLCRGLPDELVEEGETIVCSVAPEHAVLMQSSGTLP
jgi:iron(III) transport system ATP-binding protein